MVEQQPLKWCFDKSQPKDLRTRPAAELVDAIRSNRPVEVRWAIIEGDDELDLSGVDYAHKLVIVSTLFNGHLNASEARFARSVDLSGSGFLRNVNFSTARIDGRLLLDGAIIHNTPPDKEPPEEPLEEPPPADFRELHVRGQLLARYVDSKVGLNFDEATMGASVGLSGSRVKGNLRFWGAEISGSLYCNSFEDSRMSIEGAALLGQATIGGGVSLAGAKLGHEDHAEAVRKEAEYALQLEGARIGGTLRCTAVCKKGQEEQPPRHHTEIFGRVSLLGAKVGGQVIFEGAGIGWPDLLDDEDSIRILTFQTAEVAGSIFCRPSRTRPTEIHGDVYAGAAQFLTYASFDRAKIRGDLDLTRAVIKGPLFCSPEHEFYTGCGDDGSSAKLGDFKVGGNLILTDAELREVLLDGRLFEPQAARRRFPVLRQRVGRVKECLIFMVRLFIGERERRPDEAQQKDDKHILKLDRARISKLEFKEAIPEEIDADGLKVDELQLPGGTFQYTTLLKRTQPFRKSTYLALETLLRNKGMHRRADNVYVAMCRRDLTVESSPTLRGRLLSPFSRWFRLLFSDLAIGYGAKPNRMLWLILFMGLLSLWVFHHPDALVSYVKAEPRPCPPEAQSLGLTLGVALRCHFPMLNFVGNPIYVPSSNQIPAISWIPQLRLTYETYALLISLLSWPIVVAWWFAIGNKVYRRWT